MDNLNGLLAFVRAAQNESFAGAAERMTRDRRGIGEVLLDQTVAAGIGTIGIVDDDGHVLGAARGAAPAGRRDHAPRRRVRRLAEQGAQQRPHDHLERHEHAHRVARQSDDRDRAAVCRANRAVPLGLARLHRHRDDVEVD